MNTNIYQQTDERYCYLDFEKHSEFCVYRNKRFFIRCMCFLFGIAAACSYMMLFLIMSESKCDNPIDLRFVLWAFILLISIQAFVSIDRWSIQYCDCTEGLASEEEIVEYDRWREKMRERIHFSDPWGC